MAGRNTQFTKEKMLAAVKGTGGIISAIAKNLKCERSTINVRRKEWPEVDEAIHAEWERVTDFAEHAMIKLIRSGDGPTVRWFLDRKAKDRGYGNQVRVEGELNHIGQVFLCIPDNGRDDDGE